MGYKNYNPEGCVVKKKGKFRVDEKKNIKRGIGKNKKKDLLGLLLVEYLAGGR